MFEIVREVLVVLLVCDAERSEEREDGRVCGVSTLWMKGEGVCGLG